MNDVIKIPVGIYQCNCYVVKLNNLESIIIDPGHNAKKIIETIGDLKVNCILLTHGHFDHIGAVDELVAIYNCPVYINEGDLEMLNDSKKNYSLLNREVIVKSKVKLIDESTNIQGVDLTVFNAPGHSKGSVLYYFFKLNYLFTGDVLFYDSIGRTDLESSNNKQMKESLKLFKQFSLSTHIFPGHGKDATLKEISTINQYLDL